MRTARHLGWGIFLSAALGVGCGGSGSSPGDPADTTPPVASITSPATGATVSAAVAVVASVADDVGLAEVSLEVDGSQTGHTFTQGPAGVYTASLDTTALANSTHSLRVCALDTSANGACSAPVAITVVNTVPDTTPPTVVLASPTSNATVSGAVAVTASVTDDRGVASVSLVVDDAQAAATFTESPAGVYATTLDSTLLARGSHALRVCATDSSANASCSDTVSVTVFNPVACDAPFVPNADGSACVCPAGTHPEGDGCAPDVPPDTTPPFVQILSPAPGEVITGMFVVTASAQDDRGIASVTMTMDGSRTFEMTLDPVLRYSTYATDSSAFADGAHTFQVCAVDTSGNVGCARSAVTATIDNAPDTSPPVVFITSPAEGAVVSGTITLSASVVDNRGTAALHLVVDGAQVGNAFWEDPYDVFNTSIDTTALANGGHTFQICATDTSGNLGCSSILGVTVDNVVTYSISGTLSGDVYAGVAVSIRGGSFFASTTTDGAGHYAFTALDPGTYTVRPYLHDYYFTPEEASVVVTDASVTGIDFLGRAGFGNLTVTNASGVSDFVALYASRDGSHWTGNQLTSWLLPGQSTTLRRIPVGLWYFRLEYRYSGMLDDSGPLSIGPDGTAAWFVNGTSYRTVSARVQGATAAGVALSLTGLLNATAGSTDLLGRCDFALPDGGFTLTPSKPGFSFSPSSRAFAVPDSSSVQTFTAFIPTYSVSGRVVRNAGGIPGVTVTVTGGGTTWSASTDVNGDYVVTGIPDGTYVQTATLDGYTYSPSSRTIVVNGADLFGQNFWVPSYRIAGRITGAITSGVTVQLSPAVPGGDVVTDATGAFTFYLVEDGTYVLTPIAGGYRFGPESRSVTVSGADQVDQDFDSTMLFAPFPSGTTTRFSGLWGTGDANAWAVNGDGQVWHWNGAGWSVASDSMWALSGVWGPGVVDGWLLPDVWAVGAQGVIQRRVGATWIIEPSGTTRDLAAVWGASATDAWAVGAGGTILYWDGDTWSAVPSGTTDDLSCVWGTSATDVWVGGAWGAMLHWDGAAWSSVPLGRWTQAYGIWGSSPTDVWAVGYSGHVQHWDGSTWTIVESSTTYHLYGIWGSDASDVWAVGWRGAIGHWDGAAWSGIASGTAYGLNAVWGSGPDDIWVAGDNGTLLHYVP